MRTRAGAGWGLVAADGVLLAAAVGVAMSPLGEVYAGGRWAVAALLGLLLGIGTTLLARHLGLGAVLTSLLAALGFLLVGPAAATPSQAIGGVLPSLDAERTLVAGVVQSWRTIITLPVPLADGHGELVAPFVMALAGALLATAFLWRSRRPELAVVPVVGVFVGAAAFGARATELPLLRGLLLVVLLLLWQRWRMLRTVRASWVRRVALGVAVMTVAGLGAWGLSAAVDGGTRQVLRDHVEPPLQRLDFKSPLARYRDFYKRHQDDVLFTFADKPAGDPLVRLATMDSFDGLVWNVSTTDLLSGSSAFRPAPEARGDRATAVTVGDYTGPWVPTVGHASGVSLVEDGAAGAERELLLNTATGTVAQRGEVRPGDRYRIDWEPRNDGDEIDGVQADRSQPITVQDVPVVEKLDALARTWVSAAAATNDFETAQALENGFREHGYYNDGLNVVEYGESPSGHGVKRLVDMFATEERIVGNDEQYASAMAYVAQRMGLPARVVLGFEHINADRQVTGDDIAAWVEIPFVGEGWVPFDPTPDEQKTPPLQKDSPDPKPQPYVVQPPQLPEEPADALGVPPEGSGRDVRSKVWDVVWLVLAGLWQVTKVALVLSPLWLILLFKWGRRRRRHRAEDPLERISGAWREFHDRARDLGARVPPGYTRHETSQVLVGRFPETPATPLAAVADRHVFGPGEPSTEEVDAYWADVDTALARMRAGVPWWRRVLGRFSPASIPWLHAARAVRSRAASMGGRLRHSLRRPGSRS